MTNYNKLPSQESKETSPHLEAAERLWSTALLDAEDLTPLSETRDPDRTKQELIEDYGLSPDDDFSGIMIAGNFGSPFMQELPDGTRRIGWPHFHVGGNIDNPTRYIRQSTVTYHTDNPEVGTLRIWNSAEGGDNHENNQWVEYYSLADDPEAYTKELQRVAGWAESAHEAALQYEEKQKELAEWRAREERKLGRRVLKLIGLDPWALG